MQQKSYELTYSSKLEILFVKCISEIIWVHHTVGFNLSWHLSILGSQALCSHRHRRNILLATGDQKKSSGGSGGLAAILGGRTALLEN